MDFTEMYTCDTIALENVIGEGSYGIVYKGKLLQDDSEVAIKIIKRRNEALNELNRMKCLDHPNVIRLLGCVPQNTHYLYCRCLPPYKTSLWLILEYMPFGDLQEFVSTQFKGGLRAEVMDQMAYEIASGMDYLHRKANIVHRDLAARNILVDEDNTVKIADFGLCDEYYEDQCYSIINGKPCPIRWMPPENLPDEKTGLTHAQYSRKGDVWSFGVVLYEIWSRGQLPFPNLSNEEVIGAVKKGSTVLNTTVGKFSARPWVTKLMGMCFEYDKANRPNFRQIFKFVDESSEFFFY